MKKDAGHEGLQGVVAANTSISYIDGKKGTLVYRGYSIEDLAKHSSYEEVSYLLLFGKLPTKKQLSLFSRDLKQHMHIPKEVHTALKRIPKKDPVISGLRTGVSLLAAYDPDAENISQEANRRKAIRILAGVPVIIAALSRAKQGKRVLHPKKELSFAANFLYLLRGKAPNAHDEKTIDVALILHAEHGLNASTFAGRITVATLSDIHSGMVSAIGTLKGPLHGGANEKAFNNLKRLARKWKVKDACEGECLVLVVKYVKKLLAEHIKIMGIGHRVYKVKDPRAKIFEAYAKQVPKPHLKYYQMAKQIEIVMAKEKHLYPNVDFYSGIVYESMDITPALYVSIFALARSAGWLAHMLEQYADNRLIRPASNYVGKKKCVYIPIARRK